MGLNFGGMFGGGIFMLIFWVAVVVLIVWIVRSVSSGGHGGHSCCKSEPEKKTDGQHDQSNHH